MVRSESSKKRFNRMPQEVARSKVYRQLVAAEMEKAIEALSPYYDVGEEGEFKRDIELARRGQVGIVGDMAVTAWAVSQVRLIEAVDQRQRAAPKKRKKPKKK